MNLNLATVEPSTDYIAKGRVAFKKSTPARPPSEDFLKATTRRADPTVPDAEAIEKARAWGRDTEGTLAQAVEAALTGHAAKHIAKSGNSDLAAAAEVVLRDPDARLACQAALLEASRTLPPPLAMRKLEKMGLTASEYLAIDNWIRRGLA